MVEEDGEPRGPALVAVTTDPSTTAELTAWLGNTLDRDRVLVRRGFFAGVAALSAAPTVLVVDVGPPSGRDSWRLAELRHRAPDSTVVVVADATLLPLMTGALRADLAVTRVGDLPPLRELVVSAVPASKPHQTMRRRSAR